MPAPLGPSRSDAQPPRLVFRARHRLTHAREFKAVYDAKMRKARGGVVVFTRPNTLPHHRLGLAVSARTISKAVDRNRTKRLIREWFRLNQPSMTADNADQLFLDIIVSARSGRVADFDTLSRTLNELVRDSAEQWRRRRS